MLYLASTYPFESRIAGRTCGETGHERAANATKVQGRGIYGTHHAIRILAVLAAVQNIRMSTVHAPASIAIVFSGETT